MTTGYIITAEVHTILLRERQRQLGDRIYNYFPYDSKSISLSVAERREHK